MKTMSKIFGYVVVRLPEFAVGFAHPATPMLGSKIYRGADRLPWEDLTEEDRCLSGRASEFHSLYADMRNKTQHILGVPYTESLELANEVLNYSDPSKNEIIAISDVSFVKEIPAVFSDRWRFIGYDGFSVSEWSVIREGIFWHQQIFSKYDNDVNDFGLFSGQIRLSEYCRRYVELQKCEMVEPVRVDVEVQQLAIFIAART